MTENDRLALILDKLGFKTQSSFAKALNIRQGSLSDIIRGKEGVGVSNSIKRILDKEYSINIEWLETGKGEMLKEQYTEDNDSTLNEPTIQYGVDELKEQTESLVQKLARLGIEQTSNVAIFQLIDDMSKLSAANNNLAESNRILAEEVVKIKNKREKE